MPRTLASLVVAVFLLLGPAHGYARGVHFGAAGPAAFVHHRSLADAGFLGRHINFRSLAAADVVFVPCDDPYADYPVYPPYPCYVALP
jgi:hypothetical protein